VNVVEARHPASLFDPGLVRLEMEAADARAAISELAGSLLERGKVRPTFVEAVLEREARFPTGLPTPGAAIAIPHTDAEHCVEPAVAVGILKRPVGFAEMGSPETTLEVRIVFLLSITRPEDHVEWLGSLASAFGGSPLASRLLEAGDAEQVCRLLRTEIEG
jgi:galactitol PTS system EIIA component